MGVGDSNFILSKITVARYELYTNIEHKETFLISVSEYLNNKKTYINI